MNDNMVVEALRYMLAEVEEKLTSVEEENARLKEENERLSQLIGLNQRITAFAGQLQAWGYENAARELISEILGGIVDAPDYYTLQEECRWIPVSERMPEKSGWYPAWYRHNGEWTLQEDTYYFGNGQWQLRSDGDIGCWHYPLPEPPQEVEG